MGSAPITAVATPMSSNAPTRTALRPTLSPKCPAITAPTGRAPKPAA
ncbi:Uncharacterised protein [Mycobacteroides abscessus subsp. abscessus]|nr:Uncharacterised protein [Mycobacteroides abscessus subsp. abscessus]